MTNLLLLTLTLQGAPAVEWQTDREKLFAAARESDRPIFYVHLVGKLDGDA
jgi:hypothetical protein